MQQRQEEDAAGMRAYDMIAAGYHSRHIKRVGAGGFRRGDDEIRRTASAAHGPPHLPRGTPATAAAAATRASSKTNRARRIYMNQDLSGRGQGFQRCVLRVQTLINRLVRNII